MRQSAGFQWKCEMCGDEERTMDPKRPPKCKKCGIGMIRKYEFKTPNRTKNQLRKH
jgi:hypothetical protein